MLESMNNNTFEYQRLSKEEMERRGILGRLIGPCASFTDPTRNGRHYSEQLWENVFNDPIMKERIENGVCYGELGHPTDREETDMEKIALCLAEVPKKGKDGKLRAVFDILSTPNGKILKSLCDYGSTIGISSRGSGDLETDWDGNESVNPDTYTCEGFDAVLIPAVKEARLQYVNESLNKKRYNKTLRDKLTESIDKEDETNQRIMRESLNTLGIKLNESNDYRGYELQTTQSGIFIRDSKGNILREVISDKEARDYIDSLLDDDTYDINESLNESQHNTLNENFRSSHKKDIIDKKFDELTSDDVIYVTNGMYDCCLGRYIEGSSSITTDEKGRTLYGISVEVLYSLNPSYKVSSITNQLKYNDTVEVYVGDKLSSKIDTQATLVSSSLVEKLKENFGDNFNYEHICKEVCDFIHDMLPDTEIVECMFGIHSFGDEVPISSNHYVIKYENTLYDFTNQQYNTYEEYDDWMESELPMIFSYNNFYNIYWRKKGSYVNYPFIKIKRINEDYTKNNYNINNYNINNEVTETLAADDDGALVEELQKALKLNKKLDEKIVALQEKLSAGYANEVKLNEQIEGYKSRIFKLSKSTNEVRALNEKLVTVNKSKETVDNRCKQLTESINKKNTTISELKESLNKKDEHINSLKVKVNESAKRLKAKTNSLNEITEKYETLNKDLNQLKESYSKKIEQHNALVEKYKNIAMKSVDKYIDTQAVRLGVHSSEIKNRLPESYSFKDIDLICEDLQEYKLNMSNLPFSTNNRLREGMSAKVSNVSQKTLVPMEEDIDELTLRLAGLK